MIIQSSSVSMASARSYSEEVTSICTAKEMNANKAAKLDLTITGEESIVSKLESQVNTTEREEKRNKMLHEQQNLKNMFDRMKAQEKSHDDLGKQPKDIEVEALKWILDLLNGKGKDKAHHIEVDREAMQQSTFSFRENFNLSFNIAESVTALNIASPDALSGNVWTRVTASSSTYAEAENTAFSTTGIAKTADGREISFNMEIAMSRSFAAISEKVVKEDYVLTDPLVINIGTNVAEVEDTKFFFDLNADGKEEIISMLGKNSGFLVYDKNNDGIINDGNELFGTKSGDGFSDLAKFDEDNNGWIDEADSIFQKLKVFRVNKDGSQELLKLKDLNIGAIYLGNVDTQFSMNNMETNKTNGVIQKTGFYLKENGDIQTLQHVDLAL